MKRRTSLIWGLTILLLLSIGTNIYLAKQRVAIQHYYFARNETLLGSDLMYISGCSQVIVEGKSSIEYQFGQLSAALMDGSMRAGDLSANVEGTNEDTVQWHTIFSSLDKANGIFINIRDQAMSPAKKGKPLTTTQVTQLKGIQELADALLPVTKTSNVNTGEVNPDLMQKAVQAAENYNKKD